MIRPTRYLDLDTCVLNIAAHALEILHSQGAVQYDDLLRQLQSTLSKRVRFEFVLALDLLFLTGQIDYHEEADAVVSVIPQTAGVATRGRVGE